MLSKIPQEYLQLLTVRDLETLLERKREDDELKDLLAEKENLSRALEAVEQKIAAIEERQGRPEGVGPARMEPIIVKKRTTLKEHIMEVLQEAGRALTANEIQQMLVDRGVFGSGRNPRSFYNTVFQALQRYDIFVKNGKTYNLKDATPEMVAAEGRSSASLKDYIVAVLEHAKSPLKSSEIASRVLIAGYKTDLDQDGLSQRVAVVLKKHLNKVFDWDSQRYRLIKK